MSLVVENLYKSFNGVYAIENLNFSIDTGGVLGLLGQNGAGKTTTLRMLLGLLKPDDGQIIWNGTPLSKREVKIGYLPEERGLYAKSKVIDQLRYFGELEGLTKKEINSQLVYWMEKLQVIEYKDKKAEELSKGNQQKIQIIATLLHNPDFIILDEPFSGLDPLNAEILKKIILELIDAKKTIIFSSHRLDSVEEFCRNICILKNGRVVLKGQLNDIQANYGYKNLFIKTHHNIEKFLSSNNYQFEIMNNFYRIKANSEKEAISTVTHLLENDYNLKSIEIKEPTLHQIFIEKVG
ncbi:ATP-binding cassette domain-containing protein [Neobacillus sp. PS3-40]|uniref:ABC transporter ATP-binding protein n=1 Tax=Neobacillus sp. PS3-40 TaxID=3070679 RepID=UPI0027E0101C|nr:ATP-binding cassette domain-containing protein [Neobacillus sp. PS3-40]WML46150.1 ATP-binding cassette domain-containing protein [Neobacillus sp. PS3-40]